MNSSNATEPVRLTTDGQFKRDLVFWPGGSELIYAVLTLPDSPFEGRVRLMRLKLADRSVTPFHPNTPRLSDRELAVSADGNVYAYCDVVSSENLTIVVRNLKLDKTTTIKRKVFVNRPALSPDGNHIVFMEESNVLKSLELWKDNPREVQLGEKGDLWPSFSPDGRRLAFTSRRDRTYAIYVMNSDGAQPRRLTRSPGLNMNPVFSPDGKRIAFTSNRDGNYEIYVMNADGTNVRRVTDHPERDDFPCWHPDGRQLLFVGERNGRFDIYQIEVPQ